MITKKRSQIISLECKKKEKKREGKVRFCQTRKEKGGKVIEDCTRLTKLVGGSERQRRPE